MTEQFIYCPRCGNSLIEETDYEDEHGEEDTEGRRCIECLWEGDMSELVCTPNVKLTRRPAVGRSG
jgi:hypothetical protein